MEEKRLYASLHAHSEFSNLRLIDSTNRFKRSIDYCWSLGLSGLAMTDHECLSGSLAFLDAYRAKLDKEWDKLENKPYEKKPNYDTLAKLFDFKAILGNEIYLTQEGLNLERLGLSGDDLDSNFYHYILLAKDMEGLLQLRRLSTNAWNRSFMWKGLQRVPTYPSDLFSIIDGGHVIASTACLGGYPAKQFLKWYNWYITPEDERWMCCADEDAQLALEKIDNHLYAMQDLFGKENFFIELQPNEDGSEQNEYNKFMIERYWGKFPFIFTTDSHYLNADERELHEAFLNSKSSGEREIMSFYKYAHFMSQEEVRSLMDYVTDEQFEEMVSNTIKITDMCTYYEFERSPVIPNVDYEYWDTYEKDLDVFSDIIDNDEIYPTISHHLYHGNRAENYLLRLIAHGYIEKEENNWNHSIYQARIEEELNTINEVGIKLGQNMENYFITIAKLVELMWQAGSIVGPARGSAGASLILYLLGVIQINPIKLDLPFFWRFMHPSRPDMADVDIDTETNKRQAVFNTSRDYFVKRGGEMVNVCTFGTEGTKSALKTAARGLNIDDDLVSYVTAMIPNERGFDWSLHDCYSGNGEDRKSISAFVEVMNQNQRWWELATAIEGLITRLGVHASGVVCFNSNVNEFCSLMKTAKGQLVTSFELHTADRCGLIKYDYLTVSALDRIHQCLNYMLDDGTIEWQGDLKTTYLKYLDPNKIDYETKEMWEMAADGKISSLFQFDTVVGSQSMKKIRPQTLKQIAISNSIMRLMSDGEEQPIDIYVKQKLVPQLWYDKMYSYGLNIDEIEVLEKYLKEKSGVADSQEVLMQLSMEPKISNFSMKDANALRKIVAKKKFDQIAKMEDQFKTQGSAAGNRKEILNYVWEECVKLQLGYSFSEVHTTAYSIIAVQEMNLAYHYPIIYWNCACLSIDASAVNDQDFENLIDDDIISIDEDVEKKTINKMNYAKIATALDRVKEYCEVSLPDINKSKLGFMPDVKNNTILYGLKGISKVTDPAIEEIMMNRPFKSLDDFLNKVTKKTVTKDKVINLIKCGAFNNIEGKSTKEILSQFIWTTCEPKKKLTLQNLNMLIDLDLLPVSLNYKTEVYKLTKEMRRHKDSQKLWYIVDSLIMPEDKIDIWKRIAADSKCIPSQINVDGEEHTVLSITSWDSFYESQMNEVRSYIKTSHDELLGKLNLTLFTNEWNKYCSGGELEWQLDSMNFFFNGHPLNSAIKELDDKSDGALKVNKLNEIVEDAQDGSFFIKGKIIPKMKLFTIAGTVIDRDNTKGIVTIQCPDGVVTLKVYKNLYALLSRADESTGEESFFEKGVHLLVTGIQRGATFVPKVYKSSGRKAVERIIISDVSGGYKFKRLIEKEE